MISEMGAFAERLGTDELNGIVEIGGETSGRVGASADAGADGIRKVSGHLKELSTGLFSNNELEIAHHQREGMRSENRTDAVDRIFIVAGVGVKC